MPKPFFLFAPGAGAPSTHPWMQKWKYYLESVGEVALFDYDYMREGRKRPDPSPQLIAAHRSALAEAREKSSGPIFLIGKSMGGRIGCHVALEEEVVGLICLGYPLCGGGDRTKLRDKVLRDLTAPILFIQGTRDSLCPLDLLEAVRAQMTAPNNLQVVDGGDHSLLLRKTDLKRLGRTQNEIDDDICTNIAAFAADVVC